MFIWSAMPLLPKARCLSCPKSRPSGKFYNFFHCPFTVLRKNLSSPHPPPKKKQSFSTTFPRWQVPLSFISIAFQLVTDGRLSGTVLEQSVSIHHSCACPNASCPLPSSGTSDSCDGYVASVVLPVCFLYAPCRSGIITAFSRATRFELPLPIDLVLWFHLPAVFQEE